MNKYVSRVTSSARGETFNPLIYPSLICTLVYGLGFTIFSWVDSVNSSSLHRAMTEVNPIIPPIWGSIAIATIVVGFTFLLFNVPPAGRISGLVGFMLWVFAGICWSITEAEFVVFAVAVPNLWFWIWQYLSLSRFKGEQERDAATMEAYDHGEYDVDKN